MYPYRTSHGCRRREPLEIVEEVEAHSFCNSAAHLNDSKLMSASQHIELTQVARLPYHGYCHRWDERLCENPQPIRVVELRDAAHCAAVGQVSKAGIAKSKRRTNTSDDWVCQPLQQRLVKLVEVAESRDEIPVRVVGDERRLHRFQK